MRVGFDPVTERELFVLNLSEATKLLTIRIPSPRFVCLLLWDAEKEPDTTLTQVAMWLLESGAVYVCCWGSDAERVHDAIDTVDISRNPTCDRVVMTTWHGKKPLAEAVYFALDNAWPDEGYAKGCGSVLAVCIGSGKSAEAVRVAFTDPAGSFAVCAGRRPPYLFQNRQCAIILDVMEQYARCAMPVQTKAQILGLLREHQPEMRLAGVLRCGLFGSFARDESHAQSDVDILVEFEPDQKTFDHFMQLAFFLEDLLGRKVDLVTRESLSPYIGPHILREVEFATASA